MTQIAAELGISASGLNLNDSRVRALAGKPSGPISYSDLRGKSSFSWVNSNTAIEAYLANGPSTSFMLDMNLNGSAAWYDTPFNYFNGIRPANVWVMFDNSWMYLSGNSSPSPGNTWLQLSNSTTTTYYYRTANDSIYINAYWTDNPAAGAKGHQLLYLYHGGR